MTPWAERSIVIWSRSLRASAAATSAKSSPCDAYIMPREELTSRPQSEFMPHQGFFNVPVDHLYASSVFIPYIQSLGLDNMVIATPDVGGAKRSNSYAKYLDLPLVLCHKQRAKANVVANMTVIGDVKDKNVILIDDMCDTAGTIVKAAQLMIDNGAKSVRALCSHAIMSDPATERVEESPLTEMIFTNSIPYRKHCDKCTIISVAKLFADTIRRVHDNESISSQYLIK